MFDRFTERGRKTMSFARQAAQRLQHDYIGPEHVLLGLIEADGTGVKAMRNSGIDTDAVRDAVEKLVRRGTSTYMGQLPFTPGGKRVLELALEEALSLGHRHIGTEHLLLGLICEGEGLAAQALHGTGAKEADVRAKVLELVPADPNAKPPRSRRAERESSSRDGKLRIFSRGADGSKTEIDGDGVDVEFSDGREIRVSFASYGEGRRGVSLRSEFHSPGTQPPPRVPTGVPDVVTALVIHPGAGNLMRVTVEARRRADGGDALVGGASPPARSFFARKGDARTPIDAASIALHFGNGRDLVVGDVGMPDRPGFVGFLASSQLSMAFGACNVVHVEAW